MILTPSDKYVNYIFYSKHFLNCPTHMFNSNISDLVRGYDTQKAMDNLRCFFKQYQFKYTTKELIDIVSYHANNILEFFKLNVNPYIDNPPSHIITRANYVEAFIKSHTREEWRYGNLISSQLTASPYKY